MLRIVLSNNFLIITKLCYKMEVNKCRTVLGITKERHMKYQRAIRKESYPMIEAYSYITGNRPVKLDKKYPVSKRSELKRVYDTIVRLNKSEPFYKINLSKENKEYTIGVKEAAIALKQKLQDMADPQVSGFHKKKVSVSDERILSAQLLEEDTEGLPAMVQLKVNNLASVQVNRGKELLMISRALKPGGYEFKVRVMDETYSLSYYQGERVENQYALKQMAEFLNQSMLGINALVEKGSSKDYGRLSIIADTSGRFGDKKFVFEETESYGEGIVDFFGLNRMEEAPAFAHFTLGGMDKQTATNAFTLENKIHITLHESSEQPVTLKVVSDSNSIMKAVDSVLTSYNSLVRLAKDRTQYHEEHYKAGKLINELKNLQEGYRDELEACGLKVTTDGDFVLEDSLAIIASEDGGMESLFTRENGFIARLLEKSEAITINPLEYLDKTIVTYPDFNRNIFRNPYVTSMYSGLFYNSFC